jgi:HSP20 family protein
MTLTLWKPLRELEEMSDRLNRLFTRQAFLGFNGKEMMTVADWIPSVDIGEDEGGFEVQAELPGIKREDVKVTLENGVLTLQGERKQDQEEKGRKILRTERSYGRFLRRFTLPDSVDESQVKAEFKDGILALHLPKTEKAKPRAIEVRMA